MQNYSVQKSFSQKKEKVVNDWYHVDAENVTLGHMAVKIATVLMGKHKPTYTPHVDCGDFVVVTNAKNIHVTGQKREKKLYHYHTGYIGGLRTHNLDWMLEHKPDQVVRLAVRRMLPKTKMGKAMLKKLKVYADGDHRHSAQQPKKLEIK